ncbi:bifunctional diguanylate cyclase/phosphodiesterase [Methylovorus mays]|uniref:bifunctional diguanylate cyclase/phosphodiesterase n=1 Tax=Methylovorus mays TaxID=184077 RepID=UPI001E642974|nr:EAL domain-containing protein [Methylovorus mays]MCB5206905.1 EAL domain-containing protein [Methylovorus mays]
MYTSLNTRPRPLSIRNIVKLSLIVLVYCLLGRLNLWIPIPDAWSSLISPTAGFSLAILLVFGYRAWPAIFIGSLITHLNSTVYYVAATMAVGDTLETLLACYLLKQVARFDLALIRLRDFLTLVFFAVGISPLVSAFINVLMLMVIGADPTTLANSFTNSWLEDAFSYLLFTPAVLAIYHYEPIRWNWARAGEALLVAGLIIFSCLLTMLGAMDKSISQLMQPQAFMLFPLVMWAALRFHQRGAALSVLFVAMTALWGGAHELGTFAHDFAQANLLDYWMYVLVLSSTGVALSGLNAGRIRSEARLKEQLDTYDALLHAQADVNEGVAIIHRGKIVYGNDALWRIGGYSPGDIPLGSDFFSLIHPSDRKRVGEIYQQRLQDMDVPTRYEALGLGKNGRAIHIEIAAAQYRDDNQRIVTLIIDISSRKKAEAELLKSQQDYRELVESVQAIVWRAIPGGKFTFVSNEAEALLGYPLAQWTQDADFWVNKIHPDDRDWVVEYCRTESLKLKSFGFDYRMIAADGRVVWMKDIVKVIPNMSNTRPAELVGVMLDITASKAAESDLRLARQVFDNTAEGIVITDPAFRVLEVNQAYQQITGYEKEEIIGKLPSVMQAGLHEQAYYDLIRQTLEHEGQWVGEIWNRRKSGESYPEWLSISKVTDAKGSVQNYVAVFTDITQRKLSEERLQFLANHDALTHLPNRALLQERIDQALNRAQRNKTAIAVLFIDLDRFKIINDTLGHQTGDMLLQEAAKRLKECLRETDTVARQGGDEFVVLVEDCGDTDYLNTIARKIMATLAQPFILVGRELFISASIGISVYPDDGLDTASLLKHADAAMYRAKESGKNTFRFYAAEANTNSVELLTLENNLRRAVERNEFVLHYQPKVDLRSQKIIGAEAVVRWQHPELGMLSPMQFIPLAEETGLIIDIGAWIMRESCRQAVEWQQLTGQNVRVAVNLSARQFRDETLRQTIADALAESGLTPDCLELEITESMIMHNAERAREVLQHFHDLGAHVLIDDFGTGYSSFGYLKHFPIDSLKIDRSFVRDIPDDVDDMAITQAIIAMAHSLQIKVVAEGVETQEQLAFLKKQGCDQIQGFLFSEPLHSHDFVRMLKLQPMLRLQLGEAAVA